MKASREKIKALIVLSPTIEEADKIIVENYGFENTREKIAFLKGMFDIEIIEHEKLDKMTYYAMLNTIISL